MKENFLSNAVMIRRIETESVRSLAAAQNILDVAAAIKELLDNSIDAKATQISTKTGCA